MVTDGNQTQDGDHFEMCRNIESLCCEQELTQCDKSIILKTTFLKKVYENDEKFAYRLIYNGDANEYICLEPMQQEAILQPL